MMISHISNLFLLFSIIFTTIFLCLSSSFEMPTTYTYSSILGPKLDMLPNENETIKLFQLWKKEHGRVYNDLEEMENRFDIFVSNLKYITETNAKRDSPHSFRLGLTNFADLSPKEFEERYLHGTDMPTADEGDAMNVRDDDVHLSSCSAPSSLDWRSKRAVTDVKNQGDYCGSCWAFSAVGAIEGITAIVTGQLINLSEQELVDCDTVSQGCKKGWVHKAFDWVKGNKGIALQRDYVYTATKGVCKASKIPNSKFSSINSYKQVEKSENGLLCATAKQPISVCLYAPQQDFQHYPNRNEIYEGTNCPVDSDKRANHCMLIVGYDSVRGKDYWIVKNSWGEGWGVDGYMWIRRSTNKKFGVCGINAWAYNPVKSKSLEGFTLNEGSLKVSHSMM